MKVKVAKYIADFLAQHGVEHLFTVTGGGAMHLNDAFGHHPIIRSIYNHHEQACAIAAEGYARLTGRVAAVCVTSGPGGTNAITGVLGGWLDSIPMFIVSGQVKRETTIRARGLDMRQLGDQEYDIVASVKPMTKYAEMILDPNDIRYCLERAWYLCMNGRPGPVWIDVPLDVQASIVETDDLRGFDGPFDEKPRYDTSLTKEILQHLAEAKRPVILAGTGVRLAGALPEFHAFVERMKIPVVTAWNAHDVLPDSSPYFCGRPGTVGTRGGNFVVQNADCLLVLGCRLNIRQISYNYQSFAQHAYKIVVDIDKRELSKPTVKFDMPVWADVKDVFEDLNKQTAPEGDAEWLQWAHEVNLKYPATLPSYYESERLNPYVFFKEFTEGLRDDDIMVCGNGSACVIGFQAAAIKLHTRLFTNSGCAAMGYGFPAAIGAVVAEKGHRVICIDGDGSFQMNLQELQTVVYNRLNLKIIYLNNNGYHSIRQTQTNLFRSQPLVGVSDGNGISFPDMQKIAWAYGIPYARISKADDIKTLLQAIKANGPFLAEVVVDTDQNFAPKLSSKVLPDGRIVSPEIDDMFPFLEREEYEQNKLS